jgi:hypothetical protein
MPIILGILLLLGVGGGVVVKSNDARPGDAFFSIDQAIEKIQLVVSSEDGKKELNAKFAKERLNEVEDLLAEKSEKEKDNGDDKNATSTDNENDGAATSSDDLSEDNNLDEEDEHIAEGLSFAIDLLGKIDSGDQYSELISKLNSLLKELPDNSELQIKLSDSGASFLKINSEGDDSQKLEAEVKETGDGNFIIKQRNEDGKLEVEIESPAEKIKIKTEDDGKVKVETEIKKEESDIEDEEVEVEIEDENEDLKDSNSRNDDKDKSEDDEDEDEGSDDSQDDD